MLITRKSPVTGRINTLSIDVDQPQIDAWESGMLIQDAMPDLTADEREFIMTGSHENDWFNHLHFGKRSIYFEKKANMSTSRRLRHFAG